MISLNNKQEQIYFQQSAHFEKGDILPAVKVGHSSSFLQRRRHFEQLLPTSNVIAIADIVFDQLPVDPSLSPTQRKINRVHNKKIAIEQEKRILNKFKHLNVANHKNDCEVILYTDEVKYFIAQLKKIEQTKDIVNRKVAVNRLFLQFNTVPLFINDKKTPYYIDLDNEIIISNSKIKDKDVEGRIQLNLDKEIFGQEKKTITPSALKILIEEHKKRMML